MRLAWVAVVAACGAPPKPAPPPPVAAPPAPPPRPACVKPSEDAPKILHASGDETRVAYCVGPGSEECFALELATGTLHPLDAPPADPASASPHVEVTMPSLAVCTGGDCKDLTPQVWEQTAAPRATTNGAIAVVLLGATADVYDVAKTKKVASIRYARGDFKCGEVAMLGDTIYVAANHCEQPSGRAALYAATGRKIANVGGAEFGTYGGQHVQLEGTSYAFLGENGTKIAIQDIAKGKVQKTIDTRALWRLDESVQDPFGNPGESALIKLGPDKLAVIAGTPANGSVAVVDVASGEVKVTRAPFCP